MVMEIQARSKPNVEKVIANKYDVHNYGWVSKSSRGSQGRSLWKGITTGYEEFLKGIAYRVNKGEG